MENNRSTPCPVTGGTNHVIRRGDSFQSIAREYDTTCSALVELNPFTDPAEMTEGEVLIVPNMRNRSAHVAYGQELEDLLRLHNVSRDQFTLVNPEFRNRAPVPGQRYEIPRQT